MPSEQTREFPIYLVNYLTVIYTSYLSNNLLSFYLFVYLFIHSVICLFNYLFICLFDISLSLFFLPCFYKQNESLVGLRQLVLTGFEFPKTGVRKS